MIVTPLAPTFSDYDPYFDASAFDDAAIENNRVFKVQSLSTARYE